MRRAAIALAVTAPLLLAATPTRWRAVATQPDRVRLAGWRDAWIAALADAQRSPDAAALARDPALYDPDRVLDGPRPPAGDYRCRVVKLGAKGPANLHYVAYPWFTCRVGDTGADMEQPVTFEKIDGSQRQIGKLYAESAARAAFLGTLALGDERSAIAYGRDEGRNVAGWMERIGPARWRLVMPRPRFESVVDVMEIVPVAR